ncbi:M56 family metallopeptidase [Flavobacterium ammonificans]|uniref:Antirepressor n=1 Tax=Flavobacterium ammonificans TaxID=1751056 RepID=A0ABM7UZZ1_9FLAO|nr:M56 family metallopeptidase [Flavobacterium ammonificans]BDB53196.1 antirepressor [Flavobacterium ammonificans]
MENFLLYFAKVNGLIIAFYLLYWVFLRKETFYVGNRWYLLAGLVTSIILPLITFTKFVWVDPEPISKYIEVVPLVDDTTIRTVSEEPIDWSLILSSAYVLVSLIIILKVGIEIASFFNKIIKLNKQKDTNFTLIYSNSTENPFSFFKYIVINPTLFSKEEYEHIITHERIHVKQFHSIDVLISKVFCALFWINPIIWLYRKAMLQNLEFIADNHSLEQIESKYEYQKTLLKVVANQQSLSITNPFYQSLIKKRIIMLHTNQSHKRNAWKYATIIPVLVGFMLLFQIETIAQVKDNSKIVSYSVEVELDNLITSKTTDDKIKAIQKSFDTEDYNLKINNIKRNKVGEIIAIRLEFSSKKNSKRKIIKEVRGDKPIKTIEILISENEDNSFYCRFVENSNGAVVDSFEIKKDNNNPTENYWSLDNMVKNGKEVVLIINGKIKGSTQKFKMSLDQDLGDMVEITPQEFEKKYNQKADKNKYYLEVETVKSNEKSNIAIAKYLDSKDDEKNDIKITAIKSNSPSTINPETIIYLNDKEISKIEMDKINPKTIKSVDVKKEKSNGEIRIVTSYNDLNKDTEILLDDKVISYEELKKLDKNEIESIQIKNNNGKKSIEILNKNAKAINDNSLKEVRYVSGTEEAKIELIKAKIELEKAKTEIEKAKIELEKAKLEIAKSKSKNKKK